jgi:hypothetical protein
MKSIKLLLLTAGVAAVLGTVAAGASARNLSLSEESVRAMFREVDFFLPFGHTKCQVTLEGTFHGRTIAKSPGRLIGYITRALLGPCSVGTATILRETLPWHMHYRAFGGTLPGITSIVTDIVDSSLRVREPSGVSCLTRSTAEAPLTLTYGVREGTIITAGLSGQGRVGAECFGSTGEYRSDRPEPTMLNGTPRLTLTLI